MMKTKVLNIGTLASMIKKGDIKTDLDCKINKKFERFVLDNKNSPVVFHFSEIEGVLWSMNYGSELTTLYTLWDMGIVAQNDIMIPIVILDANTKKNTKEATNILRYLNDINNTYNSIELNKE